MTFDEFFDQLPSQQSRELSNDDLIKVFKIAKNSVTIFKVDDNTLTKREKVNQFKTDGRRRLWRKLKLPKKMALGKRLMILKIWSCRHNCKKNSIKISLH